MSEDDLSFFDALALQTGQTPQDAREAMRLAVHSDDAGAVVAVPMFLAVARRDPKGREQLAAFLAGRRKAA